MAPDPVAVEDLIKHLRVEGYHVDAVLRVLLQYVDVDADGHVTRKTGGG